MALSELCSTALVVQSIRYSKILTKILRNLPRLFSGQIDQNGEYTYAVLGNTALPGWFFPTSSEKK